MVDLEALVVPCVYVPWHPEYGFHFAGVVTEQHDLDAESGWEWRTYVAVTEAELRRLRAIEARVEGAPRGVVVGARNTPDMYIPPCAYALNNDFDKIALSRMVSQRVRLVAESGEEGK